MQAYQDGLERDPGNSAMQTSLAAAQAKAGTAVQPQAPSAAAGGMGGGMDFASILSNPSFMSMAQTMMSGNPQMAGLMDSPAVKSMLSNPAAMVTSQFLRIFCTALMT